MIENGGYILEQFRYGKENGATCFLSFYSIAFLATCHVILSKNLKNSPYPESQTQIYNKLRITILLMIAFYIAIITFYGTAISSGHDRFSYWDRLPPFLAQILKNVRALHGPITAIFGYIYSSTPKIKKKKLAALIILLHSILFLLGDKLTPFFTAAFFFVTGYSLSAIHRKTAIKINTKLLTKITLAALILTGTLALGFIFQQKIEPSQVLSAFEQRLILQGHVWYGIFDIVQNKGAILSPDNLIYPNSPQSPSGLDSLSYIISDESFVRDRIARGITFTMGGPAAPLATMGIYLGALAYSILGAFYSLIIYYSSIKLRRGQFLRALISLTFLISLNSIALMGNWYSIYNSASLIFFAFAAIDLLIKGKQTRPIITH